LLKGQRWTDTDRLKVVTSYLILQNAARVEEATGVPAGTINYWRTLPWWESLEQQIKDSQALESVSRFSRIVQKTQELIEERLENGDFKLTKQGQIMRVPVDVKTLNQVADTAVKKKLDLEEALANRGTKDMTMPERLKQLEEKFTKFINIKTIEGEVIRDPKDQSGLSGPVEKGEIVIDKNSLQSRGETSAVSSGIL
jgi:hypothetical protein